MKCVALARKAVHPVGSPPSPEATRRASLPTGWPMTEAVLARHLKVASDVYGDGFFVIL